MKECPTLLLLRPSLRPGPWCPDFDVRRTTVVGKLKMKVWGPSSVGRLLGNKHTSSILFKGGGSSSLRREKTFLGKETMSLT